MWERLPAKRQAINPDSSPWGEFLIATFGTLREKVAEMLRVAKGFLAESVQAAKRGSEYSGSARAGLPVFRRCCLSLKMEKQELPKVDP